MGGLATRVGITGWPSGAAREAVLGVLGLWLEGRGGIGPAEARDAVARVRAFIEAHGASRFERVSAFEDGGGLVVNRAGLEGRRKVLHRRQRLA